MDTESRSRATTLLLVVIAAGVLVIAAVLVGPHLGGGGGESSARKAARHDAQDQASYDCSQSMDPASLGGPDYKRCVSQKVTQAMRDWDAANPDG